MAAPRIAVPNYQRAALRQYYHSTLPKPTHAELITWFKIHFGHEISQSIVSRSLSDRFKYLDAMTLPSATALKIRDRKCQWPEIERALSKWIPEMEAQGLTVSNEAIGRKARMVWDELENTRGMPRPKFSAGWVDKFRKRLRQRLDPINARPRHTSTMASTRNSCKHDKPFNFPLSLDHLIHLIQYNALRGLTANKRLLTRATTLSRAIYPLSPIKQTYTSICDGLSIIHPLPDQPLPASLYPTLLQMNCAHPSFFGMFPCPRFRDNMIKRGTSFDLEDMCLDLWGDLYLSYSNPLQSGSRYPSDSLPEVPEWEDPDDLNAGRRCLIVWDEPCNVESWEVTPGFIRKWGWTLEGCQDLIIASNQWRARRGEAPLPVLV